VQDEEGLRVLNSW